jgi:hypothetical protein
MTVRECLDANSERHVDLPDFQSGGGEFGRDVESFVPRAGAETSARGDIKTLQD